MSQFSLQMTSGGGLVKAESSHSRAVAWTAASIRTGHSNGCPSMAAALLTSVSRRSRPPLALVEIRKPFEES